MNTYTVFITLFSTFIAGFALGIIVCISKQRKNVKIEILLDELKNNITQFNTTNAISTNEVKTALNETLKLTKTFTLNQNFKGIYGENCLENVLNYCFANKNLDYIKQFNTKNEDNQKIIPDYLVKLPNNRAIIIDCKLNLEKFIEFQNAKDEFKKERKLDFARDLISTINSLYNKKYTTADKINQPDFILMYIPLEPVINLIYTDEDFLNVVKTANEKNIIIVGNSSTITTIRLVNLLWAKEKQQANISRIVEISQNIYKYFALHSKKLVEIKSMINSANESINKEFEKISKENKLFKELEELNSYDIALKQEKNGKKITQIKVEEEFLK